jgi:hypothetical protein
MMAVDESARTFAAQALRWQAAADITTLDRHPLADEAAEETLLADAADAAALAAARLAFHGVEAERVRVRLHGIEVRQGETITLPDGRRALVVDAAPSIDGGTVSTEVTLCVEGLGIG